MNKHVYKFGAMDRHIMSNYKMCINIFIMRLLHNPHLVKNVQNTSNTLRIILVFTQFDFESHLKFLLSLTK